MITAYDIIIIIIVIILYIYPLPKNNGPIHFYVIGKAKQEIILKEAQYEIKLDLATFRLCCAGCLTTYRT